jgi:hypothetical protein
MKELKAKSLPGIGEALKSKSIPPGFGYKELAI